MNMPNANEIAQNAQNEIVIKTKRIVDQTSWNIFAQYVMMMNDYLNHFTETEKFKKEAKDRIYLLINGFTTLTHVFKIMLNHSTDIDQVIEMTEKAIYYYTQFIEQMEENILHDLNVSSNNASLFVYKKTIQDLVPETQHKTKENMKNFDTLLLIYRHIVDSMIKNNTEYNSLISTQLINIAIELCRNNTDEKIVSTELSSMLLYLKHIHTADTTYDYIYIYIKKYKHCTLTLEGLSQKKIHPDYADKLQEPANNYIKWLVQ
jgi:hypothetical protein